jgi:hypothetical protein
MEYVRISNLLRRGSHSPIGTPTPSGRSSTITPDRPLTIVTHVGLITTRNCLVYEVRCTVYGEHLNVCKRRLYLEAVYPAALWMMAAYLVGVCDTSDCFRPIHLF